MAAGLSVISTGKVNAQEPSEVKVSAEEDEIKANKETFEKAQEAMDRKDFQSAIVYLSAYIASKPKKYEAYKLRGRCFYELRQYKFAQRDFETAIKLKTNDDKFITGTKVIGAVVLGADKQEQYQNPELGNLYAELMYAQKAQHDSGYETSYQKAGEYNSHIYLPKPEKNDIAKINCPQKYGKKINTQGVDTYIYGAIDDIAAGNYHEAVYKIQNITSNYPKYYLGYYLTGVAYNGLEQEQDAVTAFETSLKYNPYDFESLASLGQIYYAEAEKTFSPELAAKSTDYFKKALKYNPNCYLYHYYIGLNNLQSGNLDEAIASFDNAIKNRSNDYNSMYYRAIAQYLKGDYKPAAEGCTKLLYRHVSNYNSVLYLKALAEYKQGLNEEALADIEKIQNSMNDIYNADLKTFSPKESTLENYLYYLKAKLEGSSGIGTAADYTKAVKNPIIACLSKVEQAVTKYSAPLNDGEITSEEYNAYKNFYDNSMDSLLAKCPAVTLHDVENQYDYIRTTFDDLGLSFVYSNPDYKFTTIKDYAAKRYAGLVPGVKSERTAAVSEDITAESENILRPAAEIDEIAVSQNDNSIAKKLADGIFEETSNVESISGKPAGVSSLKASTLPEETLLDENQTSMARLLASNGFNTVSPKNNKTEILPTPDLANSVDNEIKPVTSSVGESLVQSSLSSDTAPGFKFEAGQMKDTPDFTISYKPENPLEKPTVNTDPAKEIKNIEGITVSAVGSAIESVEKGVEDFTISYENTSVPAVPVVETEARIEDIENLAENVSKPQSTVVEKHAQVDLNKFNLPKVEPEIKDTDEVIVLEPKNFLFKADQEISQEPYSISYPKNPDRSLANVPAEPAIEQNLEEQTEVISETVNTSLNSSKIANADVEDVSKKPTEEISEVIPIEPVTEKSNKVAVLENIKNSAEIEQSQEVNEEKSFEDPTVDRIMLPSMRISDTSASKARTVKREIEETIASSFSYDETGMQELFDDEVKRLGQLDEVQPLDENPESSDKNIVSSDEVLPSADAVVSKPKREKKQKAKKEKPVKQIVERDDDKASQSDVDKPKKEKRSLFKKKSKSEDTASAIVQSIFNGDVESDESTGVLVKTSSQKAEPQEVKIKKQKDKKFRWPFTKKTKTEVQNDKVKTIDLPKSEEIDLSPAITYVSDVKKPKIKRKWFWNKKAKTDEISETQVNEVKKKEFSWRNLFRRKQKVAPKTDIVE